MTNEELKEATFVLAGYIVFAWGYYKFVMWLLHKAKDKYIMVAKAYAGTMFAFPLGMLAIMILKWLYSIIFGGG